MPHLTVFKLKRIARFLFGFIAVITAGCLALKDVRVVIPTAVLRGNSALLFCHFNMEGDSLYSVKWYKGRREFYRYTPNEDPPIKIFPIQGLNVDKSRSNDTQLMLSRVQSNMSGRYSCEVSADAPSFHTSLVSGEMDVVEVPGGRPTISGVKPRYRLGDMLHSNCSSPWSRPAAKLTWLVNDVQATPAQLVHYYPMKDSRTNREMSLLGLQILVKPQHFLAGRLKIRCIAGIHDLYWQSTEKSVEEDRPKGIKLGAVGPEFVPKLPPEAFTSHPHFRDDLYDQYQVRERPPPAAVAGARRQGKHPLLSSFFLLVLTNVL
ncbi:uncharacterized protein [Anabrus simplex]|uniref:uncharacterized protein n=1 Tax=Anabrus simplex TaxID=316456 RepID=UPI0034DD64E6